MDAVEGTPKMGVSGVPGGQGGSGRRAERKLEAAAGLSWDKTGSGMRALHKC